MAFPFGVLDADQAVETIAAAQPWARFQIDDAQSHPTHREHSNRCLQSLSRTIRRVAVRRGDEQRLRPAGRDLAARLSPAVTILTSLAASR
jgi:hypothetical protein